MKRTFLALSALLSMSVVAEDKTLAHDQMIESNLKGGIINIDIDGIDSTFSGYQVGGGLQWDNGLYGKALFAEADSTIDVFNGDDFSPLNVDVENAFIVIGRQMRINRDSLWFAEAGRHRSKVSIYSSNKKSDFFLFSAGYKRYVGNNLVATASAEYINKDYKINGELQYTIDRNFAVAVNISFSDEESAYGIGIKYFPSQF